jgi:hypothetical protein
MTDVANTPDRRYTASRKIRNVHLAVILPIRRHLEFLNMRRLVLHHE